MLDDEMMKTQDKRKKRPDKASSLPDIKLERQNKRRKQNRETAQRIETLEAQVDALKKKRQLLDEETDRLRKNKQHLHDLLFLIYGT